MLSFLIFFTPVEIQSLSRDILSFLESVLFEYALYQTWFKISKANIQKKSRWRLSNVLRQVLKSVLIDIRLLQKSAKNQQMAVSKPRMPLPTSFASFYWSFIEEISIQIKFLTFYRAPNQHRLQLLFAKKRTQMNYNLLSNLDESFPTSSNDASMQNAQIATSTKKANYSGLQDQSRKKGRKKHWKPHENQRYVEFLKENIHLFSSNREEKRLMKINILMSNYVKSKNSTQCRSHHQKMITHYKTIENIICCLNKEEQKINLEEVKLEEVKTEPFVTLNLMATEQPKEEFLEEVEDIYLEKPKEKDVFEVLDEECWGYEVDFIPDPEFFF